MPNRTCTVQDCDKPHVAKGLCDMHYRRLRNSGTTDMDKRICPAGMPLPEKLIFHGWEVSPSGCHLWLGPLDRKGYGIIRHFGKNPLAHRVAYEHHVRQLSAEEVVRHRCDQPRCINPAHLEAGTQADNMLDMQERARSRSYRSGRFGGLCALQRHRIAGEADLYRNPASGAFQCRACKREYNAAYLKRRRSTTR